MAKKRLGIYISEKTIAVLEMDKQAVLNSISVSPEAAKPKEGDPVIPEKFRVSELLQSILNQRNIDSTDVYLSLPSKDIILRSFFVPWMTPNEVKGVVEFEAKRYIPFKLETLVYNYHTTNVTENNAKKIQILFVATRQETINTYQQILEQSGLKLSYAEPSVLSLLRLLTATKTIHPKQNVALIQVDGHEGNIIIADNGVPQFVRDFRIIAQESKMNENTLNASVIREIRISLDYFFRQYKTNKVDKVLLISSDLNESLVERLNKELSIETESIEVQELLPQGTAGGLGTINAYGAALRGTAPFPVSINLAQKQGERSFEQLLEESPFNYALIAKVGGVCLGILLLLFVFVNLNVASYVRRVESLKSRLDIYEALSIEELEAKLTENKNELNLYQNIRLNSNLSLFLNKLPEMMPQGMWLKKLDVTFSDVPVERENTQARRRRRRRGGPTMEITEPKVNIELRGYVYFEPEFQQVQLVYEFIRSLKNDTYFSEVFKDFNLQGVNKQMLEGYPVTEFSITLR